MLVDSKAVDLCKYRMDNAEETLDTAKLCMEHKRYKEAVAYFNQNYVATNIFEREIGKEAWKIEEKTRN